MTQRETIIELLKKRNLTTDELFALSGIEERGVLRGRLSELRKDGVIETVNGVHILARIKK